MYQLAIYERVSTEAQDYAAQHTAIEHWLHENAYKRGQVLRYEDKATGGNLSRRGIERLGRDIASGRVTHVAFFSIDRFCRELLTGLNCLDEWSKAGCRMTFIADNIDIPGGPMADAMLKLIISIKLCMAEAERTRIRERTRLGQLSARARGVKFGRPVTVPASRIRALRRQGVRPAQIARDCQCSRASVYRALEGASEKSGE